MQLGSSSVGVSTVTSLGVVPGGVPRGVLGGVLYPICAAESVPAKVGWGQGVRCGGECEARGCGGVGVRGVGWGQGVLGEGGSGVLGEGG